MASRLSVLLLAGLVACTADTGETAEQADETAAAETANPETTAMSADEAALDEVRSGFVEHYNLHHASMVADMYTEDAGWLAADGAVHEGRAAILAAIEEDMAGSPTLDLVAKDSRVFGDHAVQLGTYTVQTTPPGGTAMSMNGHYLTLFERVNGEWKIGGVVTNFNEEPPADFPWAGPMGETPPDNGTMNALTDAYVTHHNLGHASMVADLFTDDAVVAFPNQPLAEGRAAFEAAITESLATGSPQLEIHDVDTVDFGGGWAADAGWYNLTMTTESGEVQNTGTYASLVQQQADGSWKLHWLVVNGHPAQN